MFDMSLYQSESQFVAFPAALLDIASSKLKRFMHQFLMCVILLKTERPLKDLQWLDALSK